MKRTPLLLLLLLAALATANAQQTINGDTSRYLFAANPDTDTIEEFRQCGCGPSLNAVCPLNRYVVPVGTRIYGVAAAMRKDKYIDGLHILQNPGESIRVAFYRDSKVPGQVILIDSFPLTFDWYDDAAAHHKWIRHRKTLTPGIYTPFERLDTVVEIYFPEPITAPDTFYAGIGYCSQEYEYFFHNVGVYRYLYPNHADTGYINACDPEINYSIMVNSASPFFPIIAPTEPDRSECITPPAPTLHEQLASARTAFLTTQPNPGVGQQQIAFGPWPSDPDTLETRQTTFLNTYQNLDTGRYYAAWVRNECLLRFTCLSDTHYFSSWSEPLIFYLGTEPDTTGSGSDTTGISIAQPQASAFTLSPNPTTGEVTVEVTDWTPGMTLELLDLQGRLLKSITLDSQLSTLNLQPLPAGTYLLRLTTPQGTSTQRLVKQ